MGRSGKEKDSTSVKEKCDMQKKAKKKKRRNESKTIVGNQMKDTIAEDRMGKRGKLLARCINPGRYKSNVQSHRVGGKGRGGGENGKSPGDKHKADPQGGRLIKKRVE